MCTTNSSNYVCGQSDIKFGSLIMFKDVHQMHIFLTAFEIDAKHEPSPCVFPTEAYSGPVTVYLVSHNYDISDL